MRKRAICAALMTAALFAATPEKSYGLGALAAGAKTSCKPTAPAGSPQYRTQVNCDPADVESFHLTFEYDISLLTFVGTTNLNGYTDTAVFSTSFGTTGVITMSGFRDSPLAGENDVIGLIFDLQTRLQDIPASYDAPLNFSVTAGRGDFVRAVDEETHETVTYGPDEIIPSFAALSLNQIHDEAVPLPSAAWGGMALLGSLGVWRSVRPRSIAAKC